LNKILSIIGTFFLVHTIFSQPYGLGLNPASTNWGKIENGEVRVIFPLESTEQAQRVANLVHFLQDEKPYTLGDRLEKVSIILHNQSITPNGFVTVGPFRSELYQHGPMQNFGGSTPWIDLLTIHEFRHIHQFSNAKRSWTRVMSWLFGENGWGAATVLALPRWFLEGDAVFYETALTQAGRGRMPEFENEYKVLLTNDIRYGYEKASATSLKHFVPDWYTLGYYMTTAIRRQEGVGVWEEMVREASTYQGIFYPLSRSYKKRTGLRTPQFYRATMDSLQIEWKRELEQKELTTYQKVNQKKKRAFTHYYNPRIINSDRIVAEKVGFRDIPSLMLIDLNDGSEKKLTELGFFSRGNSTISTDGHNIYWAEMAFDERWANQEYSVVMKFDLQTRTKSVLTRKSRYLAPTVSPGRSQLAAIHYEPSGQHELHLLYARSGQVRKKILPSENYQLAFPTWKTETEIYIIVKKDGLNAIAEVNTTNNEWNIISPFWPEQISYLNYENDQLYFTGIFGGTDNIFTFDPSSKTTIQITETPYGGIQPAINEEGSDMIYAQFGPNGYDIAMIKKEDFHNQPINNYSETLIDYFEPVVSEYNPISEVQSEEYPVEPFEELSGLRLHSWTPNLIPPNFGVTVLADDPMSTFSATGTYLWNVNEETGSVGIGMEYGKYYPVFITGYNFSNRQRYVPIYSEERDENDNIFPSLRVFNQSFSEHYIEGGIKIPLNLTTGNIWSSLEFTSKYRHQWVTYDVQAQGENGTFGAADLSLSFGAFKRRARQQVQPRLGLFLNMDYLSTIGTERNQSYYFQSQAIVLLPGLFRNHSFYIIGANKREPFTAAYKFRDNFFYSRGYFASLHDRINRFGLNYQLPLLLPDLPIGPFLFIQRIKGNFFFDYSDAQIDPRSVSEFRSSGRVRANARTTLTNEILRSTGVEVTFDFRFLRSLDLDIGFRYSRLLDDQGGKDRNHFDLIVASLGIP
jgi:hypothetical protein